LFNVYQQDDVFEEKYKHYSNVWSKWMYWDLSWSNKWGTLSWCSETIVLTLFYFKFSPKPLPNVWQTSCETSFVSVRDFLLNFQEVFFINNVTYTQILQAWRSQVRFLMVSLEFFVDIILPTALWPWGDSASNRNEYQEYLLGGKGGQCIGLTTLPPSCADCLEIWESQPPGTVRPCPGLKWDSFTFLPYLLYPDASDPPLTNTLFGVNP
jgi:hypothetical protein